MTEKSFSFTTHLQSEIPHIRRYAHSLVKSHEDGEDLMQTALERAWRRRHQFRPGTELRRWLFTIVRNAHIDHCRQRARRGPHVPVEDWYRETHQPAGQEKWLEVKDVERGLKRLRPEEQQVVTLSVIRGLPHDTIARRLDIAVGTVKSRLSRARSALAA